MKKRIFSILLCAAMGASLLVGCGQEKTATTDPTITTEGATTTKTSEADEPTTEAEEGSTTDAPVVDAGDMHIEIVSKGFQHQYWQAVKQGAESKAAELGISINFIGPNSESDIADQVQMLNNAINTKPAAIALAALDTEAMMDSISQAQTAGIPIVGFDSGVPDAPAGAIVANAATDNYAAGALAAENMYEAIKDRVASADAPIRIGVLSQDATSDSIISRGLGFIDKMAELLSADGKTATVEGNDKFVTDSKVDAASGADVIFEVVVPATVTAELSATDCTNLLNKSDIIAIYGSNQHSGQAMVTANENLKKFGTGDDQVIGVAFDSGAVIKAAVADGTLLGAVTQAPVAMGEAMVELCVKAAKGESVSDVDTGAQWYTADNMNNPEIDQNLYD